METSFLKKISFFLLLTIGCLPVLAQAKVEKELLKLENEQLVMPYKAKADFNLDTLKFLEYNFHERQVQYKGKKVSDVLKDLDMPILYLSEVVMQGTNPPRIPRIALVIHQVGEKHDLFNDYLIFIDFVVPLNFDDFKKASGFHRENPNPVFTQKFYEYLKDMELKKVFFSEYFINRRSQLRNLELQKSDN